MMKKNVCSILIALSILLTLFAGCGSIRHSQ